MSAVLAAVPSESTRTYGRLVYQAPKSGGAKVWGIAAEPHVMVKVKRFFGRARQIRGSVVLNDTLDIARDLEWFMERYPLDMTPEAAARLAERAGAHRAREEAVLDVLAGGGRDYGLRPPARPARPYQDVAANLAMTTGRLLLTDDVGLGKTQSGILALRAQDALPALVVTLTHLPGQWEREINTVLPWLKTHVIRGTKPYDPKTLRGVDEDPDVLIMGYSKLAGWGDHLLGRVRTVLFDEMQELRHPGTLKYEAAAAVADQAAYVMGLTATPVYNYGIEAFNLLDVLEKGCLGSREEFVAEWCHNDVYATKIKVKDPAALGAYLRDQGLMLGRTRKEVGRELPDAITAVETVDVDTAVIDQATTDAAELARMILAKDTERTDRFRAAGELDMRMRQATGVAKAPHVAKVIRLLLESEPRVVLYGWHREVYDLWLDELADFKPVLYTGTENPAEKARNANLFMGGQSRVLIMSLRSGAGLDGLQKACRVVVFGELDWSPQVHEQCIGRLRRDGADDTEPVVAYYLVAESGSDPAVAEVLQVKRNQAEPMLSKDGRLFARPAAETDRVKDLARHVLRASGQELPPEEAAC